MLRIETCLNFIHAKRIVHYVEQQKQKKRINVKNCSKKKLLDLRKKLIIYVLLLFLL